MAKIHPTVVKINEASFQYGTNKISSIANGRNEDGTVKNGTIVCNKGTDLIVTANPDLYQIRVEPIIDQYGNPAIHIYTEESK